MSDYDVQLKKGNRLVRLQPDLQRTWSRLVTGRMSSRPYPESSETVESVLRAMLSAYKQDVVDGILLFGLANNLGIVLQQEPDAWPDLEEYQGLIAWPARILDVIGSMAGYTPGEYIIRQEIPAASATASQASFHIRVEPVVVVRGAALTEHAPEISGAEGMTRTVLSPWAGEEAFVPSRGEVMPVISASSAFVPLKETSASEVLSAPVVPPDQTRSALSIFEDEEVRRLAGNILRDFPVVDVEISLPLPDDLCPVNRVQALLVNVPVDIPARARLVSIAVEVQGLQDRLFRFRQSTHCLGLLAAYTDQIQTCFVGIQHGLGATGEVEDRTAVAAWTIVLAQLPLSLNGLISISIGADIFETAIRLSKLVDPAPLTLASGVEDRLPVARDVSARLLAQISERASKGPALPVCTAYVLDWLHKIQAGITTAGAIGGLDLETARGLAAGLNKLVITNYAGLSPFSLQLTGLCVNIDQAVSRRFWVDGIK